MIARPGGDPDGADRRRAQKKGGVLGAVFGLFVFALVAGAAAVGGGYLWLQNQFSAPGPTGEPTTIVLDRGLGLIAIASRLEQAGLVDDDRVFRAGVMLRGAERDLKAGEYAVPAAASMDDILTLLRAGDVVLHTVTIPEGFTTAQALRVIAASEVLTGEVTTPPGEGALLPETYSVTRGETRQAVVDRMAAAHDEVLAELWLNRAPDLPIATPQEAVILASVVEREAGGYEHDLVAGVFINRLNRGMRLQADATIIYGVTGGEPLFNEQGERRTIRRSELNDAANLYNTYRHDGLPPGPIANPGRAALAGVLNPPRTDALYFVADGTGGHAFARTLAEHERNVAAWRRIERERLAAQGQRG